MHNNQQFIMNDASFSVTNPLFFLYHSWIDVQLEMKIRMCHDSSNAQEMNNYLAQQLGSSRLSRVFMANGGSATTINGNYFICEWINPQNINEFYAFFNARAIVMRSPYEIRTSFYLGELYNSVYKPNNWNNYK
jgi:hypothetical protein